MRAALRKGIKKVAVIEMDKPSPVAGEVLVAVKSCGICGSDIVRVQEENPRWDEIVLGHEFAGKIAIEMLVGAFGKGFIGALHDAL